MTRPPNAAADLIPDQRARVNVASFETYAAAQRAVDFLSDRKFPVERVAIVGEGLQTIEQVTGRLDWGRAAGLGLGQGMGMGLFIGLIFAALGLGQGSFVGLVAYGVVIGGVFGVVWGLIGYALSGGRRDFTSIGGMRAREYLLLTDPEVAEGARTLLGELPVP